MDGGPGTRSSAGGLPAGAVVVPMEAAAPAAPPAAAGAWPAWTRVSARVRWAGAAAPPPPPAAGAAAAWPAWTRLNARLAWAAALFLLGCAAAGLAFFAMILPLADSRLPVKACAPPPTDLRTASEYLLLAASAQVLAATMALLVPEWPLFAAFGWLLGWLTAYRATDVLWMLVACHGGSGALAFHFWLFFAVLCATLVVGAVVVSMR